MVAVCLKFDHFQTLLNIHEGGTLRGNHVDPYNPRVDNGQVADQLAFLPFASQEHKVTPQAQSLLVRRLDRLPSRCSHSPGHRMGCTTCSLDLMSAKSSCTSASSGGSKDPMNPSGSMTGREQVGGCASGGVLKRTALLRAAGEFGMMYGGRSICSGVINVPLHAVVVLLIILPHTVRDINRLRHSTS